ncbi:MAG: hypothetical protein KAX04_01245 [Methanomicrobia archaeon]|nr:hypothetical protein [Methanomicrobia archaeon]
MAIKNIGKRYRVQGFAVILIVLLVYNCNCLYTEYVEGKDENVYSYENDILSEKNPQKIEGQRIYDARDNVYLDKSEAILGLDIAQYTDDEEKISQKLYPDYITAMKEIAAMDGYFIPSVEMINGKLKQFNDRWYAGIEEALQTQIIETWTGKQLFLKQLYGELGRLGFTEAQVFIGAAIKLGDPSFEISGDTSNDVDALINDFLDNEFLSKPVGFYTWNDTLRSIFKQDRFLQLIFDVTIPSEQKIVYQIARALKEDSPLRDSYETIIKVSQVMTNPHYVPSTLVLLSYTTLNEDIFSRFISDHGKYIAIIPSSASKETKLFETLTEEELTKNLMEIFIDRIRSGEIDLTPTENSGFYDYQTYALEPFLLPEKAEENNRVFLTAKYKERLVNAFKTIMTKNRETHIKTLEIGGIASVEEPPAGIPLLRFEPQITHLLRLIDAYQFLKMELTNTLGVTFLESTYSIDSQGEKSSISILRELENTINLLSGLVVLSCEDLGHETDLKEHGISKDPAELKNIALEWLDNIETDPDLAQDTRVVVPVCIGLLGFCPNDYSWFNTYTDETVTKFYWATIGVRPVKLKVWYVKEPKVYKIYDSQEREISYEWEEGEYWILVDEFIEFESKKGPWTRDEFRFMIGEETNREKILHKLFKK